MHVQINHEQSDTYPSPLWSDAQKKYVRYKSYFGVFCSEHARPDVTGRIMILFTGKRSCMECEDLKYSKMTDTDSDRRCSE